MFSKLVTMYYTKYLKTLILLQCHTIKTQPRIIFSNDHCRETLPGLLFFHQQIMSLARIKTAPPCLILNTKEFGLNCTFAHADEAFCYKMVPIHEGQYDKIVNLMAGFHTNIKLKIVLKN